ncbi:MAG TPA: 30S ribosomal protein THX [Flavobacteriales bacterium]|nr:30S ribosomal protein THX [Flavobacteriales bacterium]HRE75953.1 30S ribosomal protein THX [Flavobacteriales bacterium]HRJ36478.1 30S ribosomal protein THX [Flavobacteriales bacterium]HRJ39083.1 30S ribosomal protein THX [Flavobacteriales bacterium]
MGKGDKKSTIGKRWRGSYGNTRPRKKKTVAAAPKKAKAAKKPAAKKASKKAE